MVNAVYDGVGKDTFEMSLNCLALLGTLLLHGASVDKEFDVHKLKLGVAVITA
jgi:NADPH:quinone reductase-like Zn-dependent oxidoreductase